MQFVSGKFEPALATVSRVEIQGVVAVFEAEQEVLQIEFNIPWMHAHFPSQLGQRLRLIQYEWNDAAT